MTTPDQILPRGWRDLIQPGHATTIGYDPATTENEKSNPSGLAITQHVGNDYAVAACAVWKTKDPEIAVAVLDEAMNLPHAIRPKALVIDASNERYFAATLAKRYRSRTKVVLYVAGEKTTHAGEDMPLKTFCGNLVKNAVEDGHLLLPDEDWVYRNFRGVKEEKGGFFFETDEDGNHCDLVQAVMNCLYGFCSPGSGPISASPAGTVSQRVWGALQSLGRRGGGPTHRFTS